MRWIIAASLACLFFFVSAPARAWSQGGHYTVCEIGYLNPDSRQEFANGDPQRTQIVDEACLDRAKPIVETRLRRAGIRLADAPNRSFDPDFEGWRS